VTALDLARQWGHEQVVLVRERAAGLEAVIAIHDTTLGPAVGGTRFRPYPSLDAAATDALRLSRAMTSKAAMAGMPCGGGKAVILGDPAREKTPALLRAYALAVDGLGGRFHSGPDMGIDSDDVRALARLTRYFSHVPDGASVDVPDLTAIGVLEGVRATAARLGLQIGGLRVAVQGLGAVGARLARRLRAEGARLIVADLDDARATRAADELGASVVGADALYDVECDVFSPNAAGGVISDATLPRLRCRAVAGAANEQLVEPRHGDALFARGILFAPDYVINAGGLISLLFETGRATEAQVVERCRATLARLDEVFDRAAAAGLPPDRMVAERLAAARGERGVAPRAR
jgi:leucine dehydrogenase